MCLASQSQDRLGPQEPLEFCVWAEQPRERWSRDLTQPSSVLAVGLSPPCVLNNHVFEM